MDIHRYFTFVFIMFILSFTNVSSQNNMEIKVNQALLPVAEKYKSNIAVDAADYNLVYYLKDKIRDTAAHIYRFESGGKMGSITYNAPHITVVVDEKGILKGFSHLGAKMKGENNLAEQRCKQLALSFFSRYASDLTDVNYQWVDDQTFPIVINRTKSNLRAKWVKYRDRKTGYYLWVILAPDGSIMEFDRDIYWNFLRGGRVNELWLRDDWFEKRMKRR